MGLGPRVRQDGQESGGDCVLCGSTEHRVVASIADWRDWWARRRPNQAVAQNLEASERMQRMTSFVHCTSCDLYRVEAMPSAADVAPIYDDYDYAVYERKAEAKIARAAGHIRSLKRRGARGTFLDVGANLGFATEAARRLGFEAHGIEIDPEAVAAGQRRFPAIRLEHGTAESLAADSFQADLVYCSEVIEHLPAPRAFASALAKLTKPGGLLFLTTPDAGHWRRPKPFIAWNEVKPPEHVIWFSRKSLTRLLGGAGFSHLRFGFNLKPRVRLTARR